MTTPTKSYVLSALIITGALIALLGAIATVFGLTGSTTLDISVGENYTLKTTSAGLALVVIGAALAAFTLKNLPSNTQVFAGPSSTPTLSRLQLPAFIVAGLALVGLVISIVIYQL
jgi:hypothetical protein